MVFLSFYPSVSSRGFALNKTQLVGGAAPARHNHLTARVLQNTPEWRKNILSFYGFPSRRFMPVRYFDHMVEPVCKKEIGYWVV